MIVPDRVRLPLQFDAGPLADEVSEIPSAAWTPHFNRAIYKGDWSGVALRSAGGKPSQLYPDPMADTYADTAVLASCPVLHNALARIECPMKAVRLLALGPGATIAEHSDYWLSFDEGEVRLHVPIITDRDVDFVLDGRPLVLGEGECWYLNFNLPHRVANRSSRRRVHLVVDCVVDGWLKAQFATALRE